MLIEQMPRGPHSYEDRPAIAVIEHLGDIVKRAPASYQIVFIAIVLDVVYVALFIDLTNIFRRT